MNVAPSATFIQMENVCFQRKNLLRPHKGKNWRKVARFDASNLALGLPKINKKFGHSYLEVAKMVRDPFDEFFRRMMKQFFRDLEEMEKEVKELREEKFPRFDIKRPSGAGKRSGFSIFLSSNGTHFPKIEMRRFGPSGEWEKVPLEKEKIAPMVGTPRERPAIKVPTRAPEKAALPEVKEKVIPDYNVSADIEGVAITVNAKGVENRDNVKLKFYPESVEIYAVAPKLNKGYFCTVAVPAFIDKGAATVGIEKERIIVKIPRKFTVVK